MKIRVLVVGALVIVLNSRGASVINNLRTGFEKISKNAASYLRNSIKVDKLNDFGRKTADNRWQDITPHEVLKNPSPIKVLKNVKEELEKGLQKKDLLVTEQELLLDALGQTRTNLFKLHAANALDTSLSEWVQRIKNFATLNSLNEKLGEIGQALVKDFGGVLHGFTNFTKKLVGFSPELKKIQITQPLKERLHKVARKGAIAAAGGAAAYGTYEYVTRDDFDDDFDEERLDDFEDYVTPEPPISPIINQDKITEDSSIVSEQAQNNQVPTTPITAIDKQGPIQTSYFSNVQRFWGAFAGLAGLTATVGLLYKYFLSLDSKDKQKKELLASIEFLQQEIGILEEYLEQESKILLPDQIYKFKKVLARKRFELKKLQKQLIQ